MIINIKGASGSGKSTLVRKIMALYPVKEDLFIPDRKRPIAYRLSRPQGKDLFIIGHYETACGGCDTIKKADDVYDLVRLYQKAGADVLFEGLLLTADKNRAIELNKTGWENHIIAIDISLEECLTSINQRRQDAWKAKCKKVDAENYNRRKPKPLPDQPPPVNPKHTTGKWKQLKNVMRHLKEAGCSTHWLNRDDAFTFIKQELKL